MHSESLKLSWPSYFTVLSPRENSFSSHLEINIKIKINQMVKLNTLISPSYYLIFTLLFVYQLLNSISTANRQDAHAVVATDIRRGR